MFFLEKSLAYGIFSLCSKNSFDLRIFVAFVFSQGLCRDQKEKLAASKKKERTRLGHVLSLEKDEKEPSD